MTLGVHGALLLAAFAQAAPAQTAPPLPRLAIERFPPAARAAVERARQQATARPSDAAAAGALGRTLHAWEQWEAAHAAYTRAQVLAPQALDWHYLDGVVLQRLGRHAEAASRFRAALTVAPGNLPARVKLAESLLEAGAVKESSPLFDDLARDPLTEPMGRFGLGRVAAAAGRHEAAVEHLERAVTLFPEWGAAHYALALSYRALGRRDDAQRALERHARYGARWPALEDDLVASVMSLRDDPRATLQRGLKLAERGDLAGAIAAHEDALARDPALVQAHANLISLYGRTRNWERAEAHYNALVSRGLELGDAHYDYGVLLGLQERWDEAAKAYEQALAVNPLHARAHNNLGEIRERRGNREGALVAYRQAIDCQPAFRLARFNLGRLLLVAGRTDDAIAELEKLKEPRDAEAPRYLFALAAAYVRAGRKEAAVRQATDAHRLALEHGQQELAAAIARDLARLK